jgi:hypothetical protein
MARIASTVVTIDHNRPAVVLELGSTPVSGNTSCWEHSGRRGPGSRRLTYTAARGDVALIVQHNVFTLKTGMQSLSTAESWVRLNQQFT